MSYRTAYRRFVNLGAASGSRARGLGVTSHRLRHQYLQRHFEVLVGAPLPIKGGAGYDPARLELALRDIVERAGHSDKYKAGAYLGALRGAPAACSGR